MDGPPWQVLEQPQKKKKKKQLTMTFTISLGDHSNGSTQASQPWDRELKAHLSRSKGAFWKEPVQQQNQSKLEKAEKLWSPC